MAAGDLSTSPGLGTDVAARRSLTALSFLSRQTTAAPAMRRLLAAHPPQAMREPHMYGTDTWLVGFRNQTPLGHTARCFYLINDARDQYHARQIAVDRARSPAERGRRDHHPLNSGWMELSLLRRAPLGRWDVRTEIVTSPRCASVSCAAKTVTKQVNAPRNDDEFADRCHC